MALTGNLLLEYVLKLHYDPDEAQRFNSSKASAQQCMTAFGLSPADQELLLSQQGTRNVAALEQRIAAEDHAAHGYSNVQCHITIAIPDGPPD